MMLDTGNADIVFIPYSAVHGTPLYAAIKDKTELVSVRGVGPAETKFLAA